MYKRQTLYSAILSDVTYGESDYFKYGMSMKYQLWSAGCFEDGWLPCPPLHHGEEQWSDSASTVELLRKHTVAETWMGFK